MSANYGPIDANQTVVLTTESGREIHLWLHECDSCVSLDVWTTRGNEVEDIAKDTGDTTRAPIGCFTLTGGRRTVLDAGIAPVPDTRNYPPLTTAVLIWNDNA